MTTNRTISLQFLNRTGSVSELAARHNKTVEQIESIILRHLEGKHGN